MGVLLKTISLFEGLSQTPFKINFWAKRAVHIFKMLCIAGGLGTSVTEDSSHRHTSPAATQAPHVLSQTLEL